MINWRVVIMVSVKPAKVEDSRPRCLYCDSVQLKKMRPGSLWHECKKCGYTWYTPTKEDLEQLAATAARNPGRGRIIGENTRSLAVIKVVDPIKFEGLDPEQYHKVPEETRKRAKEWILNNIRPYRMTNSRTSYGIKHILQHDTGIYLTDGEFKGAMLAAGYAPINPDEDEWRFRVQVRIPDGMYSNEYGGWEPVDPVERRKRMGAFTRWLLRQKHRNDRVGDLARDAEADILNDIDDTHTWISVEPKTHKAYKEYLEDHGACAGALEALDQAYDEYYAYRKGFKPRQKTS